MESAGRWTLAISRVAAADNPQGGFRQLAPVAIDAGAIPALGRPIIVAGRLADPAVATEATINEEEAGRMGVGVGDELTITPWRRDEYDQAGEGVGDPGGTPIDVTVVGITRRANDLAGRLGGTSIYEDASAVTLGPAWWTEVGGDVAVYGIGVAVTTTSDGSDETVARAVTDHWPDRLWQNQIGSLFAQDTQQTIRDAIDLQALGLYLVAFVLALAGLLFAGQAVARQSRREWVDAAVLDALGMTRGSMVRATVLRATVMASAAVAVAAVVTIASSELGPIGIGRSAEPHPGITFDWFVLVIGLPLVAMAVLASALVPVATIRRRVDSDAAAGSSSRTLKALPASGVAGWAMTNSRRGGRLALGSAVIGVAIAAAAGVTAWSLVTSYDELRAEPGRFGSAWDAQVGNVGSDSQQDDTRARIAAIPGIRAVGLMSTMGIEGDPTFTIFAGEPFLGDVDFGTILAGRAPTKPTEIALGRASMRSYGVGIGDKFSVGDPNNPDNVFSLDVVGEVVVNDALASRPGVGGLVTLEAFSSMAPESMTQTYAVWIDPGVDRSATLSALQQAFPTTFIEQSVPTQVSNLGLVSGQPVWLAVIIALLAGAALTHALVTSVRGSRRQIGVLKSIGFTKRQVLSTVAWHASLITGGALLVGVPLGVVLGRLTWSAIVDNLGVVSAPVVPLTAIVGVAVLVLAAANLAALGPGWAAARTRAANALRTE